MTTEPDAFDPELKEQQLLAEATSWDTAAPVDAEPGDIPVIDVAAALAGDAVALASTATALNAALETVGFYQLVGHGLSVELIQRTFDEAHRFHALPVDVKQRINIDNPEWPLAGVGYLPMGERRLPRRAKGNLNEAFLAKTDRDLTSDDNQWLPDAELPGFRAAVEEYHVAAIDLAKRLLPLYATALDLAPDFFADGFQHPFTRLRLTHYPADAVSASDEFGIAPHVDTTFFTLLLQDGPGLTVWSAARGAWIRVPVVPDAFVVNSGELLKQWSNDRYLSARHFANNSATQSRCSIPLFVNATADYAMACLPSCWDETNPPKYPTISYAESQAVAQGE